MDVGIPRETQARERRVALTPSGVNTLVQRHNRVWVETGAGAGAGHADADYESAGATIAFSIAVARPDFREELRAAARRRHL